MAESSFPFAEEEAGLRSELLKQRGKEPDPAQPAPAFSFLL